MKKPDIDSLFVHKSTVIPQGLARDNVLVQGNYNSLKIEMWINKVASTIETAYPIR
jgi:hypothetical protein